MLLKDRVILITNVEKFAGHGTTAAALAQGATVLAHDPSFQEPSARRKYEINPLQYSCVITKDDHWNFCINLCAICVACDQLLSLIHNRSVSGIEVL